MLKSYYMQRNEPLTIYPEPEKFSIGRPKTFNWSG